MLLSADSRIIAGFVCKDGRRDATNDRLMYHQLLYSDGNSQPSRSPRAAAQ